MTKLSHHHQDCVSNFGEHVGRHSRQIGISLDSEGDLIKMIRIMHRSIDRILI